MIFYDALERFGERVVGYSGALELLHALAQFVNFIGNRIGMAGDGANERDRAGRCCKCNQEECEASHNGSSVQYASVNEITICFKAYVDAS
jgi:hypothetical protein